MDTLTKEQRFRVMSKNRGRTELERVLCSELWRLGLRYLTASGYRARFGEHLPGKPDVVFTKQRLAVFVDGCFWHGCTKCKRHSKTNTGFWRAKIARNKARDRKAAKLLAAEGWRVIRVPEHRIRDAKGREVVASEIAHILGRDSK